MAILDMIFGVIQITVILFPVATLLLYNKYGASSNIPLNMAPGYLSTIGGVICFVVGSKPAGAVLFDSPLLMLLFFALFIITPMSHGHLSKTRVGMLTWFTLGGLTVGLCVTPLFFILDGLTYPYKGLHFPPVTMMVARPCVAIGIALGLVAMFHNDLNKTPYLGKLSRFIAQAPTELAKELR